MYCIFRSYPVYQITEKYHGQKGKNQSPEKRSRKP